ncbi:MAG: hypothetical protein H6624_13535 [Bdellovibrionaceae bacterium]|nr:hypothetical protein [Bdellovibrionales bacterium]MCB9085365.1 hypothetical protein [Pseudobdellovibrionaceae bacterium]
MTSLRITMIALALMVSPLAFAYGNSSMTTVNCQNAGVYAGEDNTRHDDAPAKQVRRVTLSLKGQAKKAEKLRAPAQQTR